jgi:DNA repair protein RecO (recombination protein O)
VQTLRLLANAQLFDLDRLHRLQFTPQSLSEAMDALHYFTLHLLQQDVHSWKILRWLVTDRNPSPIPRPIAKGNLPLA